MPAMVEKCRGEDHWTIIAPTVGSMTPSPSPDMTRSTIKTPMWILAATGVSSATTDDTRMAPPYNHFPPNRSASQPPGIYTDRFRQVITRRSRKLEITTVTWSETLISFDRIKHRAIIEHIIFVSGWWWLDRPLQLLLVKLSTVKRGSPNALYAEHYTLREKCLQRMSKASKPSIVASVTQQFRQRVP